MLSRDCEKHMLDLFRSQQVTARQLVGILRAPLAETADSDIGMVGRLPSELLIEMGFEGGSLFCCEADHRPQWWAELNGKPQIANLKSIKMAANAHTPA